MKIQAYITVQHDPSFVKDTFYVYLCREEVQRATSGAHNKPLVILVESINE